MKFKNDEMDFTKENGDMDWTKENGKKEFDFSPFLETDDLEDRVTEALDGKDLLEPDAFGGSVPPYVPPAGDGERGRHEAPGPAAPSAAAPDPEDPRYAAPERPRVVVSKPRKQVYIAPDVGDEYEDEPQERRGVGEGLKWVVAVLLALALIGGGIIYLLYGRADRPSDGKATPSPAPTEQAAQTPAPTQSATPEATPTAEPTSPPLASYTVTVTAGSGGSVSPKGAVTVEEGSSVSFTITPDAGNELSQLLIDGVDAPLTETYTFTDVAGNHTLYAVFRAAATPTPAPTPTPVPTEEPTPTPAPTEPPAAETEEPSGGEEP